MDDAVNPFRSDPSPAGMPPQEQVPEGQVPEGEPVVRAEGPTGEQPASAVAAPIASEEQDEAALLDQLESDLAAVETAIASIEQIATDSVGGEQAAAEIRAAVSAERFGT